MTIRQLILLQARKPVWIASPDKEETMQFLLLRAFACFAIAFASVNAFAQNKPAPQAPQAKQQLTIDQVQLALLIKSTIMALQHANQTGNYSVLRDLGTPVFREQFDQAKLTAIFSNLRSRGVNLSPAMILAPNLSKQPELTPQNQLHLIGYFQTQPLQIQYELLFVSIDGAWRLDGLSVDAVPIQAMAVASAQAVPVANPVSSSGAPPQKQEKRAKGQN